MLRFTLFEALRRGTLVFYFIIGTLIVLAFAIWLRRAPENPDAILLFGTVLPGMVNGVASTDFVLFMLFKQSVFWIIVLGTIGTTGLITSFLEKGTVELYISKPLERWELLVSRVLGASAGVGANLLYCIIGIWLVFGIKLGVWHSGFLLAGLLVSYSFFCYFSIVSFIAVWTRNTILAIVMGLMFSFASIGLESREQGLYRLWDNAVFHRVLDALYYVTPQLDGMLTNAGALIGHLPMAPEPVSFHVAPYLYSALSATLFYALSITYFSKQDF
jgi:hypothetical protein